MNHPVIPIAVVGASRERKRQAPKGRRVDPLALEQVRVLVGDAPPRRDLLIEYLHRINDRYGQLGAPHLAALAAEMRLSQAEVYEVASFYHHFEVVKENADGTLDPAPGLTVRVCDGLSCELAGARDLLQRLPALLGRDVRVVAAPCVGRCEQAPVAVVGQRPVAHADAGEVVRVAASGDTQDRLGGFIGRSKAVRQMCPHEIQDVRNADRLHIWCNIYKRKRSEGS